MRNALIIILLLLATAAFSWTSYILDMQLVINDTSAVTVDTATTIGLEDNSDSLPGGVRPDEIYVICFIGDTNTVPVIAPSNPCTVRVQASIESSWYTLKEYYAASADYGLSNESFVNHFYERLRFVTASNAGLVQIYYGLIRKR